MRRGGCGRAPDSYHAGTTRSREIARRAAARSAASSPRGEEMNTRTRWSGVKITSVWAITSQASPAAVRHEDHLRQAGDPRTSSDITWGIFNVPEQQAGALGDVRGLDAAEFGCGTAYFSA